MSIVPAKALESRSVTAQFRVESTPSPLIEAVEQLESAAKLLLARALDVGVPPTFPDLRNLYEEVYADEEGGLDIEGKWPGIVEEYFAIELREWSLGWLARLGCVATTEECERGKRVQPVTLVFWSRDIEAVRTLMRERLERMLLEEMQLGAEQ